MTLDQTTIGMIVAVASIITTTPATAQYRSEDNLHAEYTSGHSLSLRQRRRASAHRAKRHWN